MDKGKYQKQKTKVKRRGRVLTSQKTVKYSKNTMKNSSGKEFVIFSKSQKVRTMQNILTNFNHRIADL